MKYPGNNLMAPLLLLLASFSCNGNKSETASSRNPHDIISISYSDIGGEEGEYKIVRITSDSVHAETGTTRTKTHREWKSAISPKTWHSLTSALDVNTLGRIKSSPSKQSVDGYDETFQIRTAEKYHAYVNSYADTVHYKQLQLLKDRIRIIIPSEYQP